MSIISRRISLLCAAAAVIVLCGILVSAFSYPLPQQLRVETEESGFSFSVCGNFLIAKVDDYDLLPPMIPEEYHTLRIPQTDITYLTVFDRKEILNALQILEDHASGSGGRFSSSWSTSGLAINFYVDEWYPYRATAFDTALSNQRVMAAAYILGRHSSAARHSWLFSHLERYILSIPDVTKRLYGIP